MTTEIFPYLTSLHVNDCYTYRDFDIPIGEGEGKPFRHLILTGKNGSGKTTILRGIDLWMAQFQSSKLLRFISSAVTTNLMTNETNNPLSRLPVIPLFQFERDLIEHKNSFVYKFFHSQRKTNLGKVSTVQSETEFQKKTTKSDLSNLLKQFLVNKKVNQAFAIIEKNGKAVKDEDEFFNNLEEVFKEAFSDKDIKLVFAREEYEFYLLHGDGRKVTLNQLSDGFSAFVGIILELLVRVDMIQTRQKDYTLDPPGIVLIDEPETHLHLELQYQVMPLLTRLFPNIQFIVATHSPAVTSSIKNATVFDLTTKEIAKDWVVGSSFSELMQIHFGLDNEFSSEADAIMAKAQKLIDSKKKPHEKAESLKKLLAENERYLNKAFYLALESTILQLEDELKSA